MASRSTLPGLLLFAACLSLSAAKATMGNFGISSSFCNASDLIVNPPELDTYLTAASLPNSTGLTISIDGARMPFDVAFGSNATGDTVFPHCSLATRIGNVTLHYNAFAPLSPAGVDPNFLPVVALQFEAYNSDPSVPHEVLITYALNCDRSAGFCSGRNGVFADPNGTTLMLLSGAMWAGAWVGPLAHGGSSTPINCGFTPGDAAQFCIGVNLWVAPASAARGTLFGGHHSTSGRYNSSLPTPLTLFAHAAAQQDVLAAGTSAFIGALPASGNATTDKTQRWFLQAPLLLTKGTRDLVLTMGYVELNQRDRWVQKRVAVVAAAGWVG